MKEPRVNPACNRLGHTIACERFTRAHPNLYDARLILNQQTHCFATQSPLAGKIADGIMNFECRVWLKVPRLGVPTPGASHAPIVSVWLSSLWPPVRRDLI